MVGMFVCLCLASQQPSKQEIFVPPRTGLGVKLLTTPTKYGYVLPLLLLGGNMSSGALFHDEMSKTTDVGVSDWVISERLLTRWRCLVAFMKAMNLLHRMRCTILLLHRNEFICFVQCYILSIDGSTFIQQQPMVGAWKRRRRGDGLLLWDMGGGLLAIVVMLIVA